MIPILAQPPARFTFVVGKGGVGKSTTAGALALAWAADRPVHLISTDPAHSLGDVFDLPLPIGVLSCACVPALTVEQLDAEERAAAWQERARGPLAELLEAGSYLAAAEVERLTALPLPGTGEVMAALRLAELVAAGTVVVVDTAPTGHTLRLLDAHQVIDSWCALLAALTAKSNAVALALTGARRQLAGAELRQRLAADSERFRHQVLGEAAFLVVTRAAELTAAETRLLGAELAARGLRVHATLATPDVGGTFMSAGALVVPRLAPPARGCAALREWAGALGEAAPPSPGAGGAAPAARGGSGRDWLLARPERLLLFAGKGGVGKSTCAAAAALTLARTRPVLLLGTGAGGSLAELLGVPVGPEAVAVSPGLRAAQVDAAASLAAWRSGQPPAFGPLLERVGLGGDPTLDRAVLQAIWDVSPPGIDELAALSELLELADPTETVVVDTSPTGHFLRLIALPGPALAWTRALMRLLLDYGVAGELDALTKRVIAFARQLKTLRNRLADAGWTGTVVVTVAEPVVAAETSRLAQQLIQAGIPVTATLANFDRVRPAAEPVVGAQLRAPALAEAPRGRAGLERFTDLWELV